MKLDFKCLSEPSSDCTDIYDVLFEGEFTVREFLEYILEEKKDEWGEIRLNQISRHSYKNRLCEYSHGEVVTLNEELFDAQANKIVKSITAHGGWTQMTYTVLTEDKAFIVLREQIDALNHDLVFANERIRGLTDIILEKDNDINFLKKHRLLLQQEIDEMKKASLWQRIRGWK